MWPMADKDTCGYCEPGEHHLNLLKGLGCVGPSGVSGDDDVHVMPNYGKGHECTERCWCEPELDYTSDDGTNVWVHRDMN